MSRKSRRRNCVTRTRLNVRHPGWVPEAVSGREKKSAYAGPTQDPHGRLGQSAHRVFRVIVAPAAGAGMRGKRLSDPRDGGSGRPKACLRNRKEWTRRLPVWCAPRPFRPCPVGARLSPFPPCLIFGCLTKKKGGGSLAAVFGISRRPATTR